MGGDDGPAARKLRETRFRSRQGLTCFSYPVRVAVYEAHTPEYRGEGGEDRPRASLFHYTLKGCGLVETNGTRRRVEPQTGSLLQAGDPDAGWRYPGDCIEPWRFMVFEFAGAHSMVREMQARFGCIYHWPQDSWVLREVLDYVRREAEVIDLSAAEGYRLVTELLSALLESASPPAHSNGGLVERAKREIQAHPDYSEAELAELLGVCPDHLSRVWKEKTGQHLHDYQVRQRMRRASTLLRRTSLNCTEVAREVGYKSEGYFARLFRKHAGMSPSRYRKDAPAENETEERADRHQPAPGGQ